MKRRRRRYRRHRRTHTFRLRPSPALFVVVVAAIAAWQLITPSIPVAPDRVGPPPDVSEPTPCSGACTPARAWERAVPDETLHSALALAYERHAELRPLIDTVFAGGTSLEWGDLPEGTLGQYASAPNLITMATAIRFEPASVIASVVAHEVYHASVRDPGSRTADQCVAEEVAAFSWGAADWTLVRSGHETTGVARSLDDVVERWHSGALEQMVRDNPRYQLQCDLRSVR